MNVVEEWIVVRDVTEWEKLGEDGMSVSTSYTATWPNLHDLVLKRKLVQTSVWEQTDGRHPAVKISCAACCQIERQCCVDLPVLVWSAQSKCMLERLPLRDTCFGFWKVHTPVFCAEPSHASAVYDHRGVTVNHNAILGLLL